MLTASSSSFVFHLVLLVMVRCQSHTNSVPFHVLAKVIDFEDLMEHQSSPSLFSSDSDIEFESPVQNDGLIMCASNKPFSEEAVAVLRSLYTKGMIDWGKKHAKEIQTAVSATSSSHSQVKVCCNSYT